MYIHIQTVYVYTYTNSVYVYTYTNSVYIYIHCINIICIYNIYILYKHIIYIFFLMSLYLYYISNNTRIRFSVWDICHQWIPMVPAAWWSPGKHHLAGQRLEDWRIFSNQKGCKNILHRDSLPFQLFKKKTSSIKPMNYRRTTIFNMAISTFPIFEQIDIWETWHPGHALCLWLLGLLWSDVPQDMQNMSIYVYICY